MIVTKEFTFDAGHRLSNYNGKCKYLHGHTYLLEVSVQGELDSNGMVTDFNYLKELVQSILFVHFDHRMILNKNDKLNQKLMGALPSNHFCIVNYNPTVENILKDIFNKVEELLEESLKCVRMVLHETPTSSAELPFVSYEK